MRSIPRTLSALALAALPLAGLGATFTIAAPDAAHAERGGNGNGNGGGNGGGRSGERRGNQGARGNGNGHGGGHADGEHPGRGAIASELGGLNACHANANAFENAAPNSRVGRLAAYRTAAVDAAEAGGAVDQANQALLAAAADYVAATPDATDTTYTYDPARDAAAIQGEIDAALAADPAADVTVLEAELRAATAYEAYDDARSDFESASGAADQALADAGGADLSEEARAALDACLEG